MPPFVILSVIVCYIFNLTTTKWRFISFPDVFNILRAATVLTVALLALDYIFVAPNVQGTFFFGKVTIVLFWFLEIFFLSGLRFIYRYFRYTRTRNKARIRDAAPALLLGLAADVEIALRAIESGAIKQFWPVGILSPSAADRGQLVRNTPVLGSIDDLKEVVSRLCVPRQSDQAPGVDGFGVQCRGQTGISDHPGPSARLDREPASVVTGWLCAAT